MPAERQNQTPRSADPPLARALPKLRDGPFVSKTDAELVALTLAGDAHAYGELVGRYQHDIRALARGILNDYQRAEDVAQEAFIKAFYSLAELKDRQRFGAWVGMILRRMALDSVRADRPSVSLETLRASGLDVPQPAAQSSAEILALQEEERRVLETLRGLREDYRAIILLKHVENLSYKEIAERLNMSVPAVSEKLSRVRALLKRLLRSRDATE